MRIEGSSLWLACLAVLLAGSALADSEVYRWVDKDGNVHFTDCPPPPSCDAETVEIAPGPSAEDVRAAQERLDALLADRERSDAVREQEKLERERRKVAAIELAVERKRTCLLARQNLHTMQQQLPVYTINEDGEYVYLTDEERAAEIQRMEALIAENCDEP